MDGCGRVWGWVVGIEWYLLAQQCVFGWGVSKNHHIKVFYNNGSTSSTVGSVSSRVCVTELTLCPLLPLPPLLCLSSCHFSTPGRKYQSF